MTQTRTDMQCQATISACNMNEQFTGERPMVRVHRDEILCTVDELRQSNADLLSLRAAVRRWIKASEDARDAPIGSGWSLVDYDEACAALRAEMGGIDGEGGAQ